MKWEDQGACRYNGGSVWAGGELWGYRRVVGKGYGTKESGGGTFPTHRLLWGEGEGVEGFGVLRISVWDKGKCWRWGQKRLGMQWGKR